MAQIFNQIILTKVIIINSAKIMRETLISKDITIQTKRINLGPIYSPNKTIPNTINKIISLILIIINKTITNSIIKRTNFLQVSITSPRPITIISINQINLARVILDSKHSPSIQTRKMIDLYFFKQNRTTPFKIYFLSIMIFNSKTKKYKMNLIQTKITMLIFLIFLSNLNIRIVQIK